MRPRDLSAAYDPRTTFQDWCTEEGSWGEHVLEFGGWKWDDGEVKLEYSMATHEPYVPYEGNDANPKLTFGERMPSEP